MSTEHSQSILSQLRPALREYLVRYSADVFPAASPPLALVRIPSRVGTDAWVTAATGCPATGTSLSAIRGRKHPASPRHRTKPIPLSYPQSNLTHVPLPWGRHQSVLSPRILPPLGHSPVSNKRPRRPTHSRQRSVPSIRGANDPVTCQRHSPINPSSWAYRVGPLGSRPPLGLAGPFMHTVITDCGPETLPSGQPRAIWLAAVPVARITGVAALGKGLYEH